jgi:metal-responsive CopG/Arc/MetJ family transcriptional regulator
MDSMKIAISVPDRIFQAGERLAREKGISRSELYADALAEYLSVHGAAAITERLNALYAKQGSGLDPAWQRASDEVLPDEAW